MPSQNFCTADGWIVVFCAKEKFREALAVALDLGHLREVASPIRTEGTVEARRRRRASASTPTRC